MKSTEIAHLLPVVFQRTLGTHPNVLGALLDVMEELHAPSEKILAELDRYFLPDRTDDEYLFFLARWLDLDWLVIDGGLPDEDGLAAAGPKCLIKLSRLRHLIHNAVWLHQQRGTRHGLVQFLQIATGVQGFEVWESSYRPFHILVDCPSNANLEQVRRIVECERPAFVTYELYQRGTLHALAHFLPHFLESDTGVTGFRVRQDPRRPSHIQVDCPRKADLEQVRKTIERVVEQDVEKEKPARLTYELYQRGTLDALAHFLEIDTGVTGFSVLVSATSLQEDSHPSFHLQVSYPRKVDVERVEQIIVQEKPDGVDVTYELSLRAQDRIVAEGENR